MMDNGNGCAARTRDSSLLLFGFSFVALCRVGLIFKITYSNYFQIICKFGIFNQSKNLFMKYTL